MCCKMSYRLRWLHSSYPPSQMAFIWMLPLGTTSQQRLTSVGGTERQTSHYFQSVHICLTEGRKCNKYLLVFMALKCHRKLSLYLLVLVLFVLDSIQELMRQSGPRIKVNEFDLYFKGCDYSGVRLTDSSE